MERIDTRQGFLISALVHLGLIMVLASRPATAPDPAPPKAEPPQVAQRVFLPPPAVLRQLAPIPPRPAAPAPAATPPPSRPKDRISIGPPVNARQKGPLILRREDDLTQVPKGRPNAAPQAPTPAPPASAAPPEPARSAGVTPGTPGLKLPPGIGDLPRGTEGETGKPGASRPSIADSLRNLDQRLQEAGPLGLPTGTGKQMGPFFFDPQGADFTAWLQHFKNEVYRNWIMPQPAYLGLKGHVDIEFTIERDGTMSNVKILKPAGTPAFDRAAQNALLGSRPLPLPEDYGPPAVTMQVSFFYNEGPSGS